MGTGLVVDPFELVELNSSQPETRKTSVMSSGFSRFFLRLILEWTKQSAEAKMAKSNGVEADKSILDIKSGKLRKSGYWSGFGF